MKLSLVAGFKPDRDPIVQAKAQSSWLRELLSESTGRKFSVRPVVLFPGWLVEQGKGTTREVWVMNPKALPQFLEHEPKVLEQADVNLASYHLSRFIRHGLRFRRFATSILTAAVFMPL